MGARSWRRRHPSRLARAVGGVAGLVEVGARPARGERVGLSRARCRSCAVVRTEEEPGNGQTQRFGKSIVEIDGDRVALGDDRTSGVETRRCSSRTVPRWESGGWTRSACRAWRRGHRSRLNPRGCNPSAGEALRCRGVGDRHCGRHPVRLRGRRGGGSRCHDHESEPGSVAASSVFKRSVRIGLSFGPRSSRGGATGRRVDADEVIIPPKLAPKLVACWRAWLCATM